MLDTVLVIVALLVALGGALLLSSATTGVGLFAAACLIAILARLAQSSRQHQDIMRVASAGWICMQCGTLAGNRVDVCPSCAVPRP